MSTPVTYRVFLSAVTRELGSYRVEVARVLRRKELEVRDQEHFRQGSATLLEQLRAYIEQCDAVILLVGERCGGFPSEEHVAALGTIPLFEPYRASTGQARASYTQWELFLAKHYGKKTYVFLSDPSFKRDETNSEDADLRACLAAYREWVQASGEHRDAGLGREESHTPPWPPRPPCPPRPEFPPLPPLPPQPTARQHPLKKCESACSPCAPSSPSPPSCPTP